MSPRTPQPDVSLAGVRELCSTAVSLWATGSGCDVSVGCMAASLARPFSVCHMYRAHVTLPHVVSGSKPGVGWVLAPKCLGTLVGYGQRLLAGSLS